MIDHTDMRLVAESPESDKQTQNCGAAGICYERVHCECALCVPQTTTSAHVWAIRCAFPNRKPPAEGEPILPELADPACALQVARRFDPQMCLASASIGQCLQRVAREELA